MIMDLRLNANVLVINPEGKFLFVKLKKGPFAGTLCIPGGGIHPGEFSQEAAKREILEETGIEIENIIPFGFGEMIKKEISKHRVFLLLYATGSGVLKESEEAVPSWLTYEEAEKELIPFAKESFRIWKEKKTHFTILE